jgi:hypothetical protein
MAKAITLIDTQFEILGETIGVVVSTHGTMAEAFAANDEFQENSEGDHIRTKIVTLRETLPKRTPVPTAFVL